MDKNPERGVRDLQKSDGPSSPAEREQSIPPDRILSAVANEYRLATLDALHSTPDTPMKYDALVDCVVDRIRDEDTERASDEQRQRVRIALHHTHLPKLEELRLIEYDDNTGHVSFAGNELVQDVLTLVDTHE